MAHKVTLIPGDGIGPEVVGAAVRILEATGVKFEWESYAAGADAYEKYGEYIPKELNDAIERNKVALKRTITTPIGGGFRRSMSHYASVLSSIPTFDGSAIDPASRRATRTLTSSSCAKTRKVSIQASSTR